MNSALAEPETRYAKSGDAFYRQLASFAVHIGSRVAALAGAGEVLVSSTVKDLVAGSGLAFADRGPRVLRGVPSEWRLFATGA